MRISVVTVALNAAALVAEARDSVCAQRGVDLEWVVIDGGSTDGTLDVVRAARGLPVTLLSGPDGGIYDAMNTGRRVAGGDALFFLNADDRLADAHALHALVQTLEARQADLAFGDIEVIGPGPARRHSHRHVRAGRLGHESLSHQAVLARRSCFDAVGGFDTQWRICADLDWFMRCADAGLRYAYRPHLVARCLAGGVSSREYALQMQERRTLMARHRPPLQREMLRLAAGLRRRVPPWAGWAVP